MIEYPMSKKSSNVIYSAEDESRYYLEIRTSVQNKKWNGKTPAFLFDSKGKYTKVVYGLKDYIEKVPLAAIIVTYHQGLVPDKDNIRDVLRGIHANTQQDIVIDHLTERTENNFMAFLAPSHQSANIRMGNRRTRIKRPFFYYSVFDHAQNKCFVWCGDESAGWEKYVAFDDLTVQQNYESYTRFFYFFWDKIVKPAGCAMEEPGEDSAAYYWSSPERIADRNNPYNKLLSAPADQFDRYHDGIFADVMELDDLIAALKRSPKRKEK